MEQKLTPLMRQYLEIKDKHPDEILFFRLGDFYEMFFDDAKKASSILDIALTKRHETPMCGVPYHASENYIQRLIKSGCNVAICEQTESVPSDGTIVKREVVRIITPGTVTEPNLLSSESNNFITSIIISENKTAIAAADISTGDFLISVIDNSYDSFRGELSKYNPVESLFYDLTGKADDRFFNYLKIKNIKPASISEWLYDDEYLRERILSALKITSLKGINLNEKYEIAAAGSLIEYIKSRSRDAVDILKMPKFESTDSEMILDESAISNLEIINSQADGSKTRSLVSIIDKTKTSAGKRYLEKSILRPLSEKEEITRRLDKVEELFTNHSLLSNIRTALSAIRDIERIFSRISVNKFIPADFINLSESLKNASVFKKLLTSTSHYKDVAEQLSEHHELISLIDIAVMKEPAISVESGRVINQGYNSELDRLYSLKNDAKDFLLKYESEEKDRLGIPSLKIRYNKVYGYYIEISKGQSDKAPADYLRKQTLVNAERFTTQKLQLFETDALSSGEKAAELEKKLIDEVRQKVLTEKNIIFQTAEFFAQIDFYASLAQCALENKYVRPEITSRELRIKNGRHPVVESFLKGEPFIPNDVEFSGDSVLKIITGPNMAGKSTYIRMAAVIQILAQTGSFVPAECAELPVCDRVFARIGAFDNIARGESTFLVEMTETASILNSATEKSLIVMDEVGRGTSTYDGMSIAQGIVEFIAWQVKAKTLFATHYHELTALEDGKTIENLTVSVKESIHGVEFLHKVIKGFAGKSYGIHVASLAGIPKEVTEAAKKYLRKHEKTQIKRPEIKKSTDEEPDLFSENSKAIAELKNLDTDRITPLDALNEINRIKKLI